MYRESCGTLRGAIDHQAAGEALCGWCLEEEAIVRLRAEAVPRRPTPAPGTSTELLAPVSAVEASVNRAVLAAEAEAFERDHPEGTGRRAGTLRLIPGTGARGAA